MVFTPTMQFTTNRAKFWKYLQGDFLYRVHSGLRKAIVVLISVVIGALLLAGLYTLFDEVVLPTVTEKVEEMFDYTG
ncbi:MAG: DUF6133 family protein [Eubacteriales bacterium]